MSATLSTEVFSQPLMSWSFRGMGRKGDFCPEPVIFILICPREEGPKQARRLHKPWSHVQLRQACAGPWCGAWCSALPASPSPSHTTTSLLISTQPLSLIFPSWDKAEGLSVSSPRFATKIICPHSLEVSWAHKHVLWLPATASICLLHLCLHTPPLNASSLGQAQPAHPVWNVLLTTQHHEQPMQAGWGRAWTYYPIYVCLFLFCLYLFIIHFHWNFIAASWLPDWEPANIIGEFPASLLRAHLLHCTPGIFLTRFLPVPRPRIDWVRHMDNKPLSPSIPGNRTEFVPNSSWFLCYYFRGPFLHMELWIQWYHFPVQAASLANENDPAISTPMDLITLL